MSEQADWRADGRSVGRLSGQVVGVVAATLSGCIKWKQSHKKPKWTSEQEEWWLMGKPTKEAIQEKKLKKCQLQYNNNNHDNSSDMHTYIRHTRTCICTKVVAKELGLHTFLYMHIHTYISTNISMSLCVYVQGICIHIHSFTHTDTHTHTCKRTLKSQRKNAFDALTQTKVSKLLGVSAKNETSLRYSGTNVGICCRNLIKMP